MKLEWGTPAAVRRARQELFDAITPPRRVVEEEAEDVMTTDQINAARLTLSAELNAESARTWAKPFVACSEREGAHVVRAVLGRAPKLRAAFEEPSGPRITTVDFPAQPATRERPPEEGHMIAMTELQRAVRQRYGFTESDMQDPFRRGMVDNLSRTEVRWAAAKERDALEGEVATVGAEMGLDPMHNYRDRCAVFGELVRRGHRIAGERYGRPA